MNYPRGHWAAAGVREALYKKGVLMETRRGLGLSGL